MNERCRTGNARRSGFTMVELLVVIGVISVLLAMVLPGLQRARRAAEDRRAEAEVYAIHSALRAYLAEYSRWPVPSVGGDHEGQVDRRLVRILSGVPDDRADNLRNRIFLAVSAISTNSAGHMVDPWDEPYMFSIDRNMDNRLQTPGVGLLAGQKVAVWSKGRNRQTDGDPSSANFDDLRTW